MDDTGAACHSGGMGKLLGWLLVCGIGCAVRAPNVSESADVPILRPPAAEDFVLGPGDVIDIKLWRQPDMDMQVTIAPDGVITYPLVGRIDVGGLSYPELVSTLEEGLRRFYTEPSVAVNVVKVSNQKVFVLGEVRNPAVLQVENDLSILEALTRTGGISPTAKTKNVLLIRGSMAEPELFSVNVDAIYRKGDFSQMVYLQRGDIVMVPARTITNVERYFKSVQGLLGPFVGGSVIYRNATSGNAQGASSQLE